MSLKETGQSLHLPAARPLSCLPFYKVEEREVELFRAKKKGRSEELRVERDTLI